MVHQTTGLALGGTGLEQDNVTILHDVVLALGQDLALGLDRSLITQLPERGVVVDDSLDEGLFEVTVNDTGSLGGLGAVTDGPLAHLIGTSGEERAKVESLAHGVDGFGESRLGAKVLALLGSSLVRLEASKTLLESDGNGEDGVTSGVLLDPLSDLGEVLVLLSEVVTLAQVDKVHNRLGGKEEERVDDLDLCVQQVSKLRCEIKQ